MTARLMVTSPMPANVLPFNGERERDGGLAGASPRSNEEFFVAENRPSDAREVTDLSRIARYSVAGHTDVRHQGYGRRAKRGGGGHCGHP